MGIPRERIDPYASSSALGARHAPYAASVGDAAGRGVPTILIFLRFVWLWPFAAVGLVLLR